MKQPVSIASILFLAVGLACAGVVYDNGAPDDLNGPLLTHGSEMTHWLQADNFILNQPARLQTVTFWDFELPPYFTGIIAWQIYSDHGTGMPGELLFSGSSRNISHSATGFFTSSFSEYLTTFDIGPISLAQGTYWLALHNGNLSNTATQNVYWEATENTTDPASHAKEAPFDLPWFSHAFPGLPSDLAFKLSGVAAPDQVAVLANGAFTQIIFASTTGFNYRVDYKDGLANSPWTAVSGADQIPGTGNAIRVNDNAAYGRSSRFYRVTVLYDGAGIPVITAFGIGGSAPKISFSTSAGYFYRVEYKNDLRDFSWTPVGGVETIVGTGNIIQLSDLDPNLGTHPDRFYRVTLQ